MIDPSSYTLIMYPEIQPSLIQPLSFVPRVAGIARFHCRCSILIAEIRQFLRQLNATPRHTRVSMRSLHSSSSMHEEGVQYE